MNRIILGALGLSALLIAGSATANPATKLAQLETKLDRLTTYFDANCDTDALSSQCKRVEKSMAKITDDMNALNQAITQKLQEGMGDSSGGKEANLLNRQYKILLQRLNKIETTVEQLEASDDPDKDAKIRGLETQLTLLQRRLLSLQNQM